MAELERVATVKNTLNNAIQLIPMINNRAIGKKADATALL